MHIMKKILFALGIIGFILNVEVCAGQAVSKKNTAVSCIAPKKLDKLI
jgi:hypothetical protein